MSIRNRSVSYRHRGILQERLKIDQTLRSGSFEFDLCQKSRGSSPKRTNSIPASPPRAQLCNRSCSNKTHTHQEPLIRDVAGGLCAILSSVKPRTRDGVDLGAACVYLGRLLCLLPREVRGRAEKLFLAPHRLVCGLQDVQWQQARARAREGGGGEQAGRGLHHVLILRHSD